MLQYNAKQVRIKRPKLSFRRVTYEVVVVVVGSYVVVVVVLQNDTSANML